MLSNSSRTLSYQNMIEMSQTMKLLKKQSQIWNSRIHSYQGSDRYSDVTYTTGVETGRSREVAGAPDLSH